MYTIKTERMVQKMERQMTLKLDKYITFTVKEGNYVEHIGEQRGTSTVVAFIHRPSSVCTPYIVAWDYNLNTGEWSQGHYFEKSSEAYTHYLDYIS